MTVAEARVTICAALEDLRSQGVVITGIHVDWETEVELKDQAKLKSKVQCKIHFEAIL